MRFYFFGPRIVGIRAGVSIRPDERGPITRIGVWFQVQWLRAGLLRAPERWVVKAALLLLQVIAWVGIFIACIAIRIAFFIGLRRR